MLNNSAFPHALAAESPEVNPLNRPTVAVAWRVSMRWLQLPTSLQGYLIFLLCLLILAFTMVLHVTLSAEIMRLNVKLDGLNDEYARIERHNANEIWLISQRSALADAYKTAEELHYGPMTEVRYVVRSDDTLYNAIGEPIVSQSVASEATRSAWWQQAWQRTRGALTGIADWWRGWTGW